MVPKSQYGSAYYRENEAIQTLIFLVYQEPEPFLGLYDCLRKILFF